MKKSILLFFAAILCATSASAWGYKTAAGGWNDCSGSTSKFKNVTMNSGKSHDVVMLKDVGDGLNILQNECGGQALYCTWTKTSGDIFRGTARWNGGLYCDETVVIPGGIVYIKVGSGAQVQMTAGADYTYTADVTFSTTGESYTIFGGTVNGATIKAENSMPAGGKPSTLTMSNSYTSTNSGSVHIVFDLRTNKVTETAESAPDPEPVADVTIYFVNTKSWPSVNAYVWDNSDNAYKAWAGEAMTLTGDKAHGYDVYSYTFPETYTNCIFNGNGQTENLVVNAGQYYDIASKTWYATLAEVPNPTPAVMETVYFINTGNWGKVNAYAWTSSNNGWPGAEMTQEAEQIAGFDVYSFTAEQDQWDNLIFNNGEGTQTGDLTWEAGKYYAPSKDKWYDTKEAAAEALAAPVVVTYQLKGVGGWDQPGIELVQNPDPEKASEYMLTCQAISATDAIKVVRLEDGVIKDYYGNGTVKDGVTVTVNYDGDGNITLPEGKYNFYFDTAEPEKKLWIAECPNIDVTLSGMVKNPVSRMGRYSFLSLDDEAGNQFSIMNGSEDAYGDFEVNGYLADDEVKVVGNGTWEVVDGVEKLTATLQAEENATAIYHVTATVGVATTITLECYDATYTITDPELNEVTFTGIAAGKEFTILVAPDEAGYYSDGEWDGTPILGTSVEFDDSDASEYYLGGTYIDEAGNTYEVAIFGAPAAEEPTPETDVTVYFVNTKSWPSVNAYVWGTGDPYKTWPGEAMTLTEDKAHGYDVYSYTFPAEYTNCIFNGNGQTADLSVKANQYYDIVSEAWYATLADVPYVEPTSLTYTVKVPAGTPECYITGENTGGFGTFVKMNPAAEADVFTVDIAWATESQKYKYSASASWDYEEVNEDGSKVNDRTWNERDEVKKWKTDPTAQVTPVDAYTVTVPAGTKECYIRGGFDNWADFHKMTKVDDTHYTISITGATSIHEYKYASGPDWKYAEVKEDGSDPGNRKWDDVEDIVVKWANLYNPETATDYSNQPATIYFRPSTSWKTDNARFEVWFFAGKDGAQDKFVTMTDTDNDGVYEVANDKNYAKVIFVRMNPDKAENNWDSKWNQTGDIEIPNVANNLNTCYAFWTNNIDNTAGTWVVPETIGSGDNTAFYNKYNGKTINVIVERTFTDVLHTLCLPFSLPANWIGTAYQLSGVKSNDTEELVLYVKKCNTFEAGKPYIVEPTNDELAAKEYLLVDNVTISTSLASNSVSNKTHVVTLKGILNGGGQTDGAIEYYIGTDGALHKEPTNKLALRSIVEITDISGSPVQGVRARVAFNENVETGVEDIIATDAPVKVIVNGQLIIICDGVKYNVQGQVIR